MKQNGTIALFQYWNDLRDGRPAPRRTEIEPADIKTLLADTFILERDTRGAAIFRLAGTRLCAVYGRELKGFSFASLWRGRDERLVARLTASVFDTNAVVVVTFEGTTHRKRSNAFELLLLPLDGGIESPRCLGIVCTETKPFWLGADPITQGEIESVRVVDADREPVFLKNRPAITVPGLYRSDYDSPEHILPPSNARRIRHLVVLDGGRDEQ